MRLRPALLTAACIILSAAGQAAPMDQAPGVALSPDERAQIARAAAEAGIDMSALSNQEMTLAIIAYARKELGQRIRPSEVDSQWGLQPTPRNVEAEFEAARARGTLVAWIAGLSPDSAQYQALSKVAESLRAGAGPANTTLDQVEANLERLRWAPRPLPADRVEVNIAAAKATLFRQDNPVLEMKIVVGARATKTPMFASKLDAVVFNPPWNVPASIARNEILPKAARDPGYLARNGYRIIDGQLQQRPGPGNALGQLKFDLPSPYGVYLHDTPGKAAFQREVRTLSHGCMRLEKPRELALELLAPQGWTQARIDAGIAAGSTQRVELDQPTPLVVTYLTAFVDEAGQLQVAPDVYGWDAKLTAALDGEVRYVMGQAKSSTDCVEAQSLAG